MNTMGVLEERRDPAQAFTSAAPSMQKDQVMGRRLSTDFVDEARSAVLEALDADESTSHDEVGSVSRRYSAVRDRPLRRSLVHHVPTTTYARRAARTSS